MQSGRDFVAFVHHALADCSAKPGLVDDLENLAGMIDRFHRERAGRSTLDEFSDTKARGGSDWAGGVRRFHRPDTLLQPVDQREVVCGPTEDCLAEMKMRLDKAGYDSAAVRVNNNIRRSALCPSDVGNLAVNNQQLALDDGVRVVHRHERAVFYEYRSHG